MEKKKIDHFLTTFGLQALTIAAGLILLVNPDGAAALVTKIMGWVLVAYGAAKLLIPTLKKQSIAVWEWGIHGVCIAAGVIFLARPLILADLIGRFFGIVLLLEGLRSLRTGGFHLASGLTTAAGLVLVIIPRTLTQTLLAVCGIVLIFIGVVNLLEQLRAVKRLKAADDPNIIDADT